jgi:hypothetical protein
MSVALVLFGLSAAWLTSIAHVISTALVSLDRVTTRTDTENVGFDWGRVDNALADRELGDQEWRRPLLAWQIDNVYPEWVLVPPGPGRATFDNLRFGRDRTRDGTVEFVELQGGPRLTCDAGGRIVSQETLSLEVRQTHSNRLLQFRCRPWERWRSWGPRDGQVAPRLSFEYRSTGTRLLHRVSFDRAARIACVQRLAYATRRASWMLGSLALFSVIAGSRMLRGRPRCAGAPGWEPYRTRCNLTTKPAGLSGAVMWLGLVVGILAVSASACGWVWCEVRAFERLPPPTFPPRPVSPRPPTFVSAEPFVFG